MLRNTYSTNVIVPAEPVKARPFVAFDELNRAFDKVRRELSKRSTTRGKSHVVVFDAVLR